MTKIPFIAVAVALAHGNELGAGQPPEARLTNATIHALVYLPDQAGGFYRGTRFDWAGVIGGLQFAGHDFYPQWFRRTDAAVHDFAYDGADIVASPCTAMTGPGEEFVSNGKPLAFDEAKAGGTFVKIGVGVLRKPDEGKYDPYRLYPIQDGGSWSVKPAARAIEFKHALSDGPGGYAYEYRKVVSLPGDRPQLVLEHTLRNTGRRAIQTSVYNHNFMFLDRRAPGPNSSVTFPFAIRTTSAATGGPAKIQGNRITFSKTLVGEDRAYLDIKGFGATAKDNDIRVEDAGAGVGVRITGDRPLSRLALWAIRAPLSIEPFVDMTIPPGAEFSWRVTYEYYRLETAHR